MGVVARAAQSKASVAIVSPKHPVDSRNETVYESQSKSTKDVPVVVGILKPPQLKHMVEAEYPTNAERPHLDMTVTVQGVVSANGDFIDARIVNSADWAASRSALAAAAGYKFKPATLDGNPVAFQITLTFNFRKE
jgi:TonB family protein